jgi:hypothetical protein
MRWRRRDVPDGTALFAAAGAGATAAALFTTDPTAVALKARGVVEFSRSGIATVAGTVAAPKASVVVTGVTLSANSFVLATLQQVSGSVAIKAAVPNITGSSFTIYLTQAVKTSIKIGWFIIN